MNASNYGYRTYDTESPVWADFWRISAKNHRAQTRQTKALRHDPQRFPNYLRALIRLHVREGTSTLEDIPKDVLTAAGLNKPSEDRDTKGVPDSLHALSEDQREHYEERAAILEFDAGLSRQEAERRAFVEVSSSHGREDS